MKTKLIKRLNEIMLEIVRAEDKELDAIGAELLEIEKKLIKKKKKKKTKKIKKKKIKKLLYNIYVIRK